MTVKVHLAGEEVEAVVDTGASASVVGKRLAPKLGIWKRAKKVKVSVTGDLCTRIKTRDCETNCDRIYKSS